MRFSYWEKDAFFKNIDLAIVGSGIVGLSAAICIKRKHPSWNVVVLERGATSDGASTKNAGFACFGSPSELLADLKVMSEEEVFNLVERRFKGLLNLRHLLGDGPIGYEACGGYEVFTQKDSHLFEEALDRLDYLNQRTFSITGGQTFARVNPASMDWPMQSIQGAFFSSFEGSLHSGKMWKRLLELARAEGVLILNGITVTDVYSQEGDVKVCLQDFDFNVKKLVICTNGFARQLMPELEVEPARGQVLVTEEIPDIRMSGTFHMDRGYIYFRNVGKRILLGGMRNHFQEEEKTHVLELNDNIQNALEEFLYSTIYPIKKLRIDHRWSGIMGIGLKKTTIVQEVKPHVIVGVRMGGMGVAIGTLVGKEIAELV